MYQIDFKISYSLLKLYDTSPLQFYFQRIRKINTYESSVYGDLGSAVHTGLQARIEDFINCDRIFKDELEKITQETGMFGEKIDKRNYIKCFNFGKDILDVWVDDKNKLFPEMEIKFNLDVDGIPVEVIGYIDLVAITENEIVVHDWKTNSSKPKDNFIDQAKFYSYLIYKKYKQLPKCMWHMLRLKETITHEFEKDVVEEIETKIIDFVRKVRIFGNDVSKYKEGDWDNIFNPNKDLCIKEIDRRTKGEDLEVLKVIRKGNNVFFTNLNDTKLLRALDIKFSYFVDGYMFSNLFKKRIWDGKKHVFSIKKKSIPFGLYYVTEQFIDEYNKRYGTSFIIEFESMQNTNILQTVFKNVFLDKEEFLRDYQKEAIEIALKRKIGIINLPTGVGKSIIIAELIKRINKRTLIIVSRIELLEQLKEDIKDWIGVEVGMMYKGKLDIDKQFTIASIQTLYSILKRKDENSKLLSKYLYNVAVTVFDEAHLVRNVNMYAVINKFCTNTEYTIGTTATDWRNDCHTLLMNATVGTTIYRKTPKEMEEEGWILPTKCFFIKTSNESFGDYHSAYKNVIVHNVIRNTIIKDLCEKYKGKYKILIITKMIEHGQILNNIIKDSYLINSHTKDIDRKQWFDEFKNNFGNILIGSSQIFAQGINIPSLDIIINVGAHVSNVMSIQVVGRVKRTNVNKKYSFYIDFYDEDKNYFEKASNERLNILKEFGNEIIFINDINEIKI